MAILAVGPPRPAAAAARADDEVSLPALFDAKPLESATGDDDLRKLLKERYNAAVDMGRARFQEYVAGRGTLDILLEAGRYVLRAEVELNDKPADQVRVREKYLELTKEIEKINNARFQAGQLSLADKEQAHYVRVDAEIQLLKAKRKAKETPK
jgi:hypothetical protein